MNWRDRDELSRFLSAARAERPADLLLVGGKVVDVFSGRIIEADVVIDGGRVAALSGPGGPYRAGEVIDLQGAFVAPAFIDGHIHVESTLLAPGPLAEVAVPWGTGAVVTDGHEIANVLGLAGLNYLLESSQDLPLEIFLMAPSCVPATLLETAGARLEAGDLNALLDHPRVLGLGEVMNFPGLIQGDPLLLNKLLAFQGLAIDGHAPLLGGPGLNAYAGAGPASDHECSNLEEAAQKLSRGMRIMLRQGTTAKNLNDLLPLVTTANSRRMILVTDDSHPDELLEQGHLTPLLKMVAAAGINPVLAVQMVTLNPAEHFNLKALGAVAPGRFADLVVLEDLKDFKPLAVFHRGRLAAREGRLVAPIPPGGPTSPRAMKVKPFSLADLAIPVRGDQVRVIGLVAGQVLTEHLILPPTVRDGLVAADPDRDLVKLAVVERHQATGNIGLGLVQGFGLRKGALASSVAHDCHNLIAAGVTDPDLFLALKRVEGMGGGLCVVAEGEVLAELALPIAGLISPAPAQETAEGLRRVQQAARSLGPDFDPFMALSFLALPVIPSLKLTDKGLVDVDKFDFVKLFAS